ncbi:TonB-linked outer membrane protein, SusC/RagA family [Salegentibacter agarivorans]|uniref:TonB-linked outer membrane protein, SusC/RagA family n=1 Tax=Salegentibacter agarivorans TaxID=345907 RepID=A0A1I2NQP4_9FLAO|nr:SusC/RagA family TonB-linked outer membrane protein [Salegentibacter agarivorans]SFG03601.1 TonB-linked outer membrane protein, SusC/RagA family [Salegentibacter agarivorans]
MNNKMFKKGLNLFVFFTILFGTKTMMGSEVQDLDQTYVNIQINNESITAVFQKIENQTNYTFSFPEEISQQTIKYNINQNNISVKDVLEKISKINPIDYQLVNKVISVKITKPDLSKAMYQQPITGEVIDEKGIPLPGASVNILGTNVGVITDFDGEFSIRAEQGDTLKVSYVGFRPYEIVVTNDYELEIQLETDASQLNEVVVVGYGNKRKGNLMGAVGHIDAADIALRPAADITSSLQGLLPGLNVQMNSGDPTAAPDINVRGFNSINGGGPLVLIDGIEGNLTRINPQDIESISVLKDAASAAIYGARGAFGVIIVTTKSGTVGDLTVNYTNNFNYTTPTVRTDYISDPYVYGKTVDAAIFGYNGTNFTGYDEEDWQTIQSVASGELAPFLELQEDGSNKFFYKTDWYDYIFKEWQPSTMHNISISGGSEKIQGFLSGRVYERETINNIQDSEMERYNLKSSVTYNPTSWLELSNNILFSHEQNKEFGGYRNGYGGIFSTTTWYDLMAFYPNFVDGVPTDVGRSGNGGQGGGPAMEAGNNWQRFDTEEFTNIFRAKLTPLKGLEVNLNYSNRFTNTSNSYRYNEFEYLSSDRLEMTTAGLNRLTEYRWKDRYNVLNLYGSYDYNLLNKHNFKLMVGFNQEEFDRDRIAAQQGGLLVRELDNLALGTEIMAADGSALNWSIRGYFGRFNYDYRGKYHLEVNARYDGSSRFPQDSQYGFFPSVSAGWQVDREDFWRPLENSISSLKLRASYGQLGNQNVGVNTFLQLMNVGVSSWLDNGERLNYASAPGSLPRVVSWETTSTLDFGFDLGILENKLTTTFDWYEKNTEDMYLPGMPLPAVFGAAEPRENLASLRTRGFELGIGYQDSFEVGGSPFQISTSASISNFKGIITKYSNPEGLMSTYWEGQELGQIWGYPTDGQFQSDEEALAYQDSFENPSNSLGNVYNFILNIAQNNEWSHLRAGDIKYLDVDGDGRIDRGNYTLEDHGDLQPIGNAMPKFPFGFNINANWKNFDLSVAGAGVGKQNWYPTGDIYWGTYQRPYLTLLRKDLVSNAWTPENGGEYPQIERGYASLGSGRSLYEMNDHYLKNVGFLRIKNLTLGYRLPKDFTEKFEVKQFRIYFSGENLFTWRFGDLSKYIDPEMAGSAINYSNPGSAVGRADLRSYPMGKTYSLGINISL